MAKKDIVLQCADGVVIRKPYSGNVVPFNSEIKVKNDNRQIHEGREFLLKISTL